jgi:hypothetical protein
MTDNTVNKANVPTWAYAKATPVQLAAALVKFTMLGQEAEMPTPSHITLLPNLGSIDLGFDTLTELEKWGEFLAEPITRSNHNKTGGGKFDHYSMSVPFMISGKLYQVRMTYISN